MERVRIRPVDPAEGERLREIAIASKAYWGYDYERVVRWAAKGDYSPRGLTKKEVFVAEADGRVVGWAALIAQGEVGWLEDLWIEPAWIRKGVGTQLFRRVADRAREVGAVRLEWEAEPNALGFYQRMGGRHVRDSEPTQWGRTLPVMEVAL